MRYFIFAVLPVFPLWADAQATKHLGDTRTHEVVYQYIQQMPAPPYDCNAYIARNLHYPEAARKEKIEGKVVVKFAIHEDGSISDCVVTRGVGYGCDEEAVKVTSKMPPWKPGYHEGKAVKVEYFLPVVFKLTSE